MTVLIILAVVAGLAILFALVFRSKTKETPDAPKTDNTIQTKSPLGLTVESVTPVSLEILDTMDAALTELFADCRALGYTKNLAHEIYTVVVKDDCVDHNGVASWPVSADNYDGTVFDQDPRPGFGQVFCAELVEFIAGAPTMRFFVCRGSLDLMANTTRYGCEHIILYFNSYDEYVRTATHINGAGHPIIESRNK